MRDKNKKVSIFKNQATKAYGEVKVQLHGLWIEPLFQDCPSQTPLPRRRVTFKMDKSVVCFDKV